MRSERRSLSVRRPPSIRRVFPICGVMCVLLECSCGSSEDSTASSGLDASAASGGFGNGAAAAAGGAPGGSKSTGGMSGASHSDGASADAHSPVALTGQGHLIACPTWMEVCAAGASGVVTCARSDGIGGDYPPSAPLATFAVTQTDVGCGLTTSGAVACWGDGYTTEPVACPDGGSGPSCNMKPPKGAFTAIGVGDRQACAIAPDGHIECWGSRGNTPDTPPSGMFVDLAMDDGGDACAIAKNGDITCWGSSHSSFPGPFTALSVGGSNLCALDASGAPKCLLGYIAQTKPLAGPFTKIATNGNFACALDAAGRVQCWGSAPVTQLPGPYDDIAASPRTLCGRKPDGHVECFGGNWNPDASVL